MAVFGNSICFLFFVVCLVWYVSNFHCARQHSCLIFVLSAETFFLVFNTSCMFHLTCKTDDFFLIDYRWELISRIIADVLIIPC